jgi:hypothetical protein
VFSKDGIGLTYMYSFLLNGKGILIFRTDDAEKARAAIEEHGLSYITEDDLVEMK